MYKILLGPKKEITVKTICQVKTNVGIPKTFYAEMNVACHVFSEMKPSSQKIEKFSWNYGSLSFLGNEILIYLLAEPIMPTDSKQES